MESKNINQATSRKGVLTCTPLTARQVDEADLAYLLPRLTAIFQLPQAELQSRQGVGMLAVTGQLEVQVCASMAMSHGCGSQIKAVKACILSLYY